MKEILKLISEKVMSGRYYLTIVCGAVFAYGVWAKVIPPEATTAIISAVFTSYFSRSDRGGNGVKPV